MQKPLRRQIKQKYEANIQNLNNQLKIIDHKKHHKDLRSEQAEISIRFANVQFGGANGNKIQKVMSTTRNIMSHYDLEFPADNLLRLYFIRLFLLGLLLSFRDKLKAYYS